MIKKSSASNTISYSYDMYFVVDANTFATSTGDDLKINFIASGTSVALDSSITGPVTYTTVAVGNEKKIATASSIAPGASHTFGATVEFADKGVSNNTNAGKSFVGHFNVRNVKSIAS